MKRKRSNLSRENILKRKSWFHVLGHDDWKWLWAAYAMKSFDGFIPDGYNQDVFEDGIKQLILSFAGSDGVAYILEAHNEEKKSSIPVAIVVVRLFEEAAWPHVHWFSWATDRNKIEASVAFLQELRRDAPIMILAEENTIRFFSHLGRYGLLNRSQRLRGFNGENRYLYYGRRIE